MRQKKYKRDLDIGFYKRRRRYNIYFGRNLLFYFLQKNEEGKKKFTLLKRIFFNF